MNILLIEDNENISDGLKYSLEKELKIFVRKRKISCHGMCKHRRYY